MCSCWYLRLARGVSGLMSVEATRRPFWFGFVELSILLLLLLISSSSWLEHRLTKMDSVWVVEEEEEEDALREMVSANVSGCESSRSFRADWS